MGMRYRLWSAFSIATVGIIFSLAISPFFHPAATLRAEEANDALTWGEDHVGQPVPEYMTGTECLFCHRDYVAPRWQTNPHHLNLREPDRNLPEMKALASHPETKGMVGAVSMLLGSGAHVRYLKKLEAYGKAALGEPAWHRTEEGGELDLARGTNWKESGFAENCAGCHMTAIETESVSFSSPGLDCYVCHGVLEVEHATAPATVLFSKKKVEDARVAVAICGSCHLRGGKSKSTGRPYPNNFIPGDNLLHDFDIDWSEENIASLDMIEAHIFRNARDVLMGGKKEMTCMSCHSIHGDSSSKHTELEETADCATCHLPGKEMSDVSLPKRTKNRTCDY